MNELALDCESSHVVLSPGQAGFVGRGAGNALVVDDPRVSLEHLEFVFSGDRWLLHPIGDDHTYQEGHLVGDMTLSGRGQLTLAASDGPVLRYSVIDEPHPAVEDVDTMSTPVAGFLGASVLPGSDDGADSETVPVDRFEESTQSDAPPVVPGSTPADLRDRPRRGLVGSVLFLVVVLVAYLIAAGVGHLWPFGASSGSSVVPIEKVLPTDAMTCLKLHLTAAPKGWTGVAAGESCSMSSYPGGLLYAWTFTSQSAMWSDLQTFDNNINFNRAAASSTCPAAAGSATGFVGWHSKLFASTPKQVLQCWDTASNGYDFPWLMWTIPGRSAIVEASTGQENQTMARLVTWWESYGAPIK